MPIAKHKKVLSQLEIANRKLLAMKPNILADDRKAAQLDVELNLSKVTIDRYLAGSGKKVLVTLALIGFFQKRIKSREEVLGAAG